MYHLPLAVRSLDDTKNWGELRKLLRNLSIKYLHQTQRMHSFKDSIINSRDIILHIIWQGDPLMFVLFP